MSSLGHPATGPDRGEPRNSPEYTALTVTLRPDGQSDPDLILRWLDEPVVWLVASSGGGNRKLIAYDVDQGFTPVASIEGGDRGGQLYEQRLNCRVPVDEPPVTQSGSVAEQTAPPTASGGHPPARIPYQACARIR